MPLAQHVPAKHSAVQHMVVMDDDTHATLHCYDTVILTHSDVCSWFTAYRLDACPDASIADFHLTGFHASEPLQLLQRLEMTSIIKQLPQLQPLLRGAAEQDGDVAAEVAVALKAIDAYAATAHQNAVSGSVYSADLVSPEKAVVSEQPEQAVAAESSTVGSDAAVAPPATAGGHADISTPHADISTPHADCVGEDVPAAQARADVATTTAVAAAATANLPVPIAAAMPALLLVETAKQLQALKEKLMSLKVS